MAAAAQVTFPNTVIPIRVDLFINPEGRLGGVAGEYGYRRGNVNRGQTYWSASVDFAARPKAVFDDGLKIEALMGRVQRGQSVAIPAWRKDKWRDAYTFKDAAGTVLQKSAVTGTLTIAAGAKRFTGLTHPIPGGGTGATGVHLKPGALFTVNNVLHQYDGSGGDDIDFTTIDFNGIFPDPDFSAGDEVELDNPYFVGILQEGTSIRLPRTGERFGPWTLEVVEIPRG